MYIQKNPISFSFSFSSHFEGTDTGANFGSSARLKRKKEREKKRKKSLNPGRYIDYQYRFKNEASERKSWNSVYEFIFYSWNGRNVLSTFLYGDCSSKPVCKEKMEKRKKQ